MKWAITLLAVWFCSIGLSAKESEVSKQELNDRIQKLEIEVNELKQVVKQLQARTGEPAPTSEAHAARDPATKDQFNYSRSFWFNFLPFYHMGARVSYPVTDRFTVNYWVVNGVNQVEATNGFKDELFGFVAKPAKRINWTFNYYLGQEHPDRATASNCGPIPVQPGLCFVAITPAPNGLTHIFDSYATWQATSKLTFAFEGDYFIQRLWRNAGAG